MNLRFFPWIISEKLQVKSIEIHQCINYYYEESLREYLFVKMSEFFLRFSLHSKINHIDTRCLVYQSRLLKLLIARCDCYFSFFLQVSLMLIRREYEGALVWYRDDTVTFKCCRSIESESDLVIIVIHRLWRFNAGYVRRTCGLVARQRRRSHLKSERTVYVSRSSDTRLILLSQK